MHIKCCSGSKPHDQRGHEEAHSPGCCLSLGNRGNSAQKHAGKAVVPQPEEEGRIQFSAHSCILWEHKRRFSQTNPCKTQVECLHSVKEMPAWRKQSILILPIWSVFEPPGALKGHLGSGGLSLGGHCEGRASGRHHQDPAPPGPDKTSLENLGCYSPTGNASHAVLRR